MWCHWKPHGCRLIVGWKGRIVVSSWNVCMVTIGSTLIILIIGVLLKTSTIVVTESNVITMPNFRALGVVHTPEYEFGIPRCKDCMRTPCALWHRLHLSSLVSVYDVSSGPIYVAWISKRWAHMLDRNVTVSLLGRAQNEDSCQACFVEFMFLGLITFLSFLVYIVLLPPFLHL
jgi:hypothetical protein